MMVRALLAAAAIAFCASAPAHATIAVLRGLDKTTGIAHDFIAPIGKKVKFGTLEVLARTCVKRPPEETPETSAYLEIYDTPIQDADKPQAPETEIFHGWMFWSSPALNALNHPSYDVWVMDCKS
jgi:hypothetical protein